MLWLGCVLMTRHMRTTIRVQVALYALHCATCMRPTCICFDALTLAFCLVMLAATDVCFSLQWRLSKPLAEGNRADCVVPCQQG
jgi:hypothetical protein